MFGSCFRTLAVIFVVSGCCCLFFVAVGGGGGGDGGGGGFYFIQNRALKLRDCKTGSTNGAGQFFWLAKTVCWTNLLVS